jgi:hypothetical protein
MQGLGRDFGTVNGVKIFEDANNGKSKGAAEIEFAEPAAAAKCKAVLHGCAFTNTNAAHINSYMCWVRCG